MTLEWALITCWYQCPRVLLVYVSEGVDAVHPVQQLHDRQRHVVMDASARIAEVDQRSSLQQLAPLLQAQSPVLARLLLREGTDLRDELPEIAERIDASRCQVCDLNLRGIPSARRSG